MQGVAIGAKSPGTADTAEVVKSRLSKRRGERVRDPRQRRKDEKAECDGSSESRTEVLHPGGLSRRLVPIERSTPVGEAMIDRKPCKKGPSKRSDKGRKERVNPFFET